MATTLPGHQVLPLELIDRITDEVYDSSNGSSMKDLYNLSLTSRDVGKRATALIFRIVKLTSEFYFDDDVSELHILFESNDNLAALVRILILDYAVCQANTSSPNFLFILGHMRNLNVIKLTGLGIPQRIQTPFLATFANRVNLTDIRLYDMSMGYLEFETILLSSSSLSSLLISNLEIDELHEHLPRVGRLSMAGLLIEPRAVAWEDPQSCYHGLQPKTALNLPIERLIMKLVTPSDYKIMDLLASSRLPIILPGSLKRLAISVAKGALNKAIVDRIIAFLDSSSAQSVSQLHLGEFEGDMYRSGTRAPPNFESVRLPLCTTLDLHFVISDWSSTGEGPCWFSSVLESLSAGQMPVKKVLLIFDFSFENECIDNIPRPDYFWPRLDNALSANGLDLEEIGIQIVLRAEDPESIFLHVYEESEAEESDGSESALEESEDVIEIEENGEAESDPDDSTYITDQSEYTDAEEDDDDVELEKKEGSDDGGKNQVDFTPVQILQHWLLKFALPKTNSRYHFQEEKTGSSAPEESVKTWIRLLNLDRTSENEIIFSMDEVLRSLS
ncbi:hypothetical protein IW261DRAFT_1481341 [Armillaria novae-zelandiae]|uniref:Uncharacterized protein n=1 Tax=Armillaria novae-zelandiae TaxID=153914 RepID=A0AA39UA62_9AGAR|nr:hypothetical protein IW261DRAFT_1481341 [Armillaria novae-zelandiae]